MSAFKAGLEENQVQTAWARSGSNAIVKIAEGRFDLVVTDEDGEVVGIYEILVNVFDRVRSLPPFTVEVADPARTVFTTHAWIAWKGEQPGDYLTHINHDSTPGEMIRRFYTQRRRARDLVPTMKANLADRSPYLPTALARTERQKMDWHEENGWKLLLF